MAALYAAYPSAARWRRRRRRLRGMRGQERSTLTALRFQTGSCVATPPYALYHQACEGDGACAAPATTLWRITYRDTRGDVCLAGRKKGCAPRCRTTSGAASAPRYDNCVTRRRTFRRAPVYDGAAALQDMRRLVARVFCR